MADGPSVESEIWDHYQTHYPGQVQVLGADLFNGNATQLTSFRSTTGVSFPLLLNGSAGAGNENLFTPYGDRDSYAIISKQGIVRYNAYNLWPYGDRYHLDQLRGCIDTLVSPPLDVGPPPATAWGLEVHPHPVRHTTSIELRNPGAGGERATLVVHDLTGRRVAGLWDGPLAQGVTRVSWEAQDEKGARLPAGVYLLRSTLGAVRLARPIVVLK